MPKIGAIVLAAGMSKRMGQPKLLMPLNGKPIFRYALEQTIRAKLDPIVLVGGEHTQTFQKEAADIKGITFLRNPHFTSGMSSSLKMGIHQIKDRVDASFIFLADQPFVPDLVILYMIKQYEELKEQGIRIFRPKYGDNSGHPILIDKSLFHEFLQIEGDQGGKEILRNHTQEISILLFKQSIWGMDIDTVEDYRTMQEQRQNAPYLF